VAGGQTVVDIRLLSTLAELAEAVELQQRIWGMADRDLLPLRFFVVTTNIGGQVFGAYRGSEMVGFCHAVPGIRPDGRAFVHSHMLGVLPEYRNGGVGLALKLKQRDDALARGFELVEWTFDPLDSKNAYFNVERLGAIVRGYSENHYGSFPGALQGSLPSDRCIVEWWIASARAKAAIASEPRQIRPAERIEVPSAIETLRRDKPEEARVIQRTNAALFADAFRRGLAVTGFDRTPAAGVYLLEPWE